MNKAAHPAAITARMASFVRSPMVPTPQQQIKEHPAADDSDGQPDGNLIGINENPAQDVADQEENRTQQGREKEVLPQMIAAQKGHDVRYDQSQKRNHP